MKTRFGHQKRGIVSDSSFSQPAAKRRKTNDASQEDPIKSVCKGTQEESIAEKPRLSRTDVTKSIITEPTTRTLRPRPAPPSLHPTPVTASSNTHIKSITIQNLQPVTNIPLTANTRCTTNNPNPLSSPPKSIIPRKPVATQPMTRTSPRLNNKTLPNHEATRAKQQIASSTKVTKITKPASKYPPQRSSSRSTNLNNRSSPRTKPTAGTEKIITRHHDVFENFTTTPALPNITRDTKEPSALAATTNLPHITQGTDIPSSTPNTSKPKIIFIPHPTSPNPSSPPLCIGNETSIGISASNPSAKSLEQYPMFSIPEMTRVRDELGEGFACLGDCDDDGDDGDSESECGGGDGSDDTKHVETKRGKRTVHQMVAVMQHLRHSLGWDVEFRSAEWLKGELERVERAVKDGSRCAMDIDIERNAQAESKGTQMPTPPVTPSPPPSTWLQRSGSLSPRNIMGSFADIMRGAIFGKAGSRKGSLVDNATQSSAQQLHSAHHDFRSDSEQRQSQQQPPQATPLTLTTPHPTLLFLHNDSDPLPRTLLTNSTLIQSLKPYNATLTTFPTPTELQAETSKISDILALETIATSTSTHNAHNSYRPKTCFAHAKRGHDANTCSLRDCKQVIMKRTHSSAGKCVEILDSNRAAKRHERRRGEEWSWFGQQVEEGFGEVGEFRVFVVAVDADGDDEDIDGNEGGLVVRGKEGKIVHTIVTEWPDPDSPGEMYARAACAQDFKTRPALRRLSMEGLQDFALWIYSQLRRRPDWRECFESLEVGVRLDVGVSSEGAGGRFFVNEVTRWYGADFFSEETLGGAKMEVCEAFADSFGRFVGRVV